MKTLSNFAEIAFVKPPLGQFYGNHLVLLRNAKRTANFQNPSNFIKVNM
jgi:hypothetical protein